MTSFFILLDHGTKVPLYEQLVSELSRRIQDGRIAPGTKLPSARKLSKTLGIGRNTVGRSYEILQSQGLMDIAENTSVAVSRNNLSVTSEENRTARSPRLEVPFSQFLTDVTQTEPVEILAGFNSGGAAADHIPISKWNRYLRSHAKAGSSVLLPDRDPFGHAPLRAALAQYLGRLHGVNCDGSNLAVLSGVREGIDLVARMFLNPGDTVVVENPGSRWALRIFRPYRPQIEPVPIDDDGLCVDKLDSITTPVKLIYVTPSHHDPTGAVLSLRRREALVKWANDHKAVIIEDHTDGQYRYASGALPALQTFDKKDCVIYLTTFWKVMYPVLKLGFIVFPEDMVSQAESEICRAQRDSVDSLAQYVLTDFIREGEMDRHIRKMTRVYFKRRQVLVSEFMRCFKERVRVAKESAGLQQHLELNLGMPDHEILQCAGEAGLPLVSLEPFYYDRKSQGQFVLPFALLEESQLRDRIQDFADRISMAT